MPLIRSTVILIAIITDRNRKPACSHWFRSAGDDHRGGQERATGVAQTGKREEIRENAIHLCDNSRNDNNNYDKTDYNENILH